MTTPAIIYAAKSTEDKHGSIPTQIEDCRAMAEREGWNVVGEFQDEGFSAYKRSRGPGLATAREKAAEAAPAVLVVQHSDRLARGAGDAPGAAEHLAEIMFWAQRHDVALRSVQDDDSLTSPLLAFVMGERNMEDSRRKSAAVKSGMKRRAERGQHNGGPRPYGYRWEGPKGERQLVPYEPEAVIVRRIFKEYVEGRSQQSIQRGLNEEGVTTARGGQWHQGTIGKLLTTPIPKGCVTLNGSEYPGEHPAIVPAEVWDQAALLREAAARSKGKGRGRRPKANHLFIRGHLRCGECGESMIPTTKPTKTPGRLYEVYECYGRKRAGVEFCSQEPIARAEIDEPVAVYFERECLDVEATRQQVADAAGRALADVRALLAEAQRDERQAAEAVQRIKRDYLSNDLSGESYEDLRIIARDEHAASKAKVAQLRAREATAKDGGEFTDAEEETLRYLSELRRALVGHVRAAEGVDGVRAALTRIFECFTLCDSAHGLHDSHPDLRGIGPKCQQELVPTVRPGAIIGFGPAGRVPKHVRLPLTRAAGDSLANNANGFTT